MFLFLLKYKLLFFLIRSLRGLRSAVIRAPLRVKAAVIRRGGLMILSVRRRPHEYGRRCAVIR